MKIILMTALLALAGCATTGTVATSALIDTDKAIIVAQDSYHAATIAAAVIAVQPTTSPATKAALRAANDKAAAALHKAFKLRTSAAIELAATAIAEYQALTAPTTGGK